MTRELEANRQSLYETDYLKWVKTTAEKLRLRDYSNIEWENLIEETEDMGRSERRSLKTNLNYYPDSLTQVAISARV